jgi:sortase A
VRRTVAGIGRALVTLGLLILLFVGYQLWGTGIWTARAQDNLKKSFAREEQQYQQGNPVVGSTTTPPTTGRPEATTSTTFSPARPAPPTPPEGAAEGWITIPKINIHMIFVEGTSRDDLKKGPGHYPDTVLPGTIGNAGIAGHRTTYLHPFGDIDKLVPGDDIFIQTLAGTFDYQVTAPCAARPEHFGKCGINFADGHVIVNPEDVWVVQPTPDPQITLTSCHPKGSAEHRIVVMAKLVVKKSAPVSKPRPPAKPRPGKAVSENASLAEGLSGQQRSLQPSIGWGILAAAIGLLWWWAFRRWRHPATWIAGVVPFLAVLFVFYVYLEQALPAGY